MLLITVIGTPAPQGSKRHVGRGIMVESSAKVKPWREAVKCAARDVCEARWKNLDAIPVILRSYLTNAGGISGPVKLEVTFTMHRPKSYSKRRTMPDRSPDLDKLVRSTCDALTQCGAWEDDARVVECIARKVFPGQHPDALNVPGAVIRISSMMSA